MDVIVALFALLMGIGIAAIWTLDIRAGTAFEASAGLLRARERGTDSYLAWHWAAEYGTAAALVVGGLLLLVGAALAEPVILVALGALAYTSCNSLAWAFGRPERRAYALPMLVGLVGSLAAIVILLLTR